MVVGERLEADPGSGHLGHGDAGLVDRRSGGDVEVEHRGHGDGGRRVGRPRVGVEPLEVREAPVLVARGG